MIVIADDITGAAEIAGIAFAQGQEVSLVCGDALATNETTVIATDTRSISEVEAVAETRRIISHFSHLSPLTSHLFKSPLTSHLFKKTDSALRGHVVEELSALMQVTGYQRAVYLPANPSKGRIIKDGIYYIKEVKGEGLEVRDVPISETAFSYDPEFPARTSVLKERFPDAEAKNIIMPDAESEEDIHRVIAAYNDGKTLFAGAADLFSALLPSPNTHHPTPITQHPTPNTQHPTPNTQHPSPNTQHPTLLLCGSTQSKPLDLGIPVAPMPRDIYDGSDDLTLWDTNAYNEAHSLILTIPYAHRTGKEVAVHLRTMMAEMTKRLIASHCPDHLVIEGGATAWATLQALNWTDFTITALLAPGVVQMKAVNGTLVTLKPGSYPWNKAMLHGRI